MSKRAVSVLATLFTLLALTLGCGGGSSSSSSGGGSASGNVSGSAD